MKIVFWLLGIVAVFIIFIRLLHWYTDYQHERQPLTLLKTDGPGGMGCDEFKEIYHVLKATPTIKFPERSLVAERDYVMPYPWHRYGDTTYFYRYYRRWQPDIDGIVYFDGKVDVTDHAGGENWRYGCDEVLYFEVYRIYDKRKHLLIDFTHPNKHLATRRSRGSIISRP